MRITATFASGIDRMLDGAAIGDQFDITVLARVVRAEEELVDVTPAGSIDPEYLPGQLAVGLLLSRPRRGPEPPPAAKVSPLPWSYDADRGVIVDVRGDLVVGGLGGRLSVREADLEFLLWAVNRGGWSAA